MATQRPLTPAQLAQETRKLLVSEASRAMAAISTAVQDRLTTLMNESAPSREMQARRDAWQFYQKARIKWLEAVVESWQKALVPPTATAMVRLEDDAFQLVGTDVVENKIVSSRLVLGVVDKVGPQLDDLKIRVRLLDGSAELSDFDILKPEVLILPLIEQWSVVGMQRDAWPFVHELVLRMLIERLQAAYTMANDYLIKQGVLPTIDLKDRVKRIPSAGAPPRPSQRPTSKFSDPASSFGGESGESAYPPSQSGRGNYGSDGGASHRGDSGASGGQGPARQEAPFGGRLGWGGDAPGAGQGQGGPPSSTRGRAEESGTGGQNRAAGSQGFQGDAGQSGPQGRQAPPAYPGGQGGQGQGGQGPGPQGGHHQPVNTGAPAPQASAGYGSAHEETRMMTATTPLARARSRAQGVMGQLKRLLIGRVGPEAEASSFRSASPALAAAIAVRPAPDTDGYGDGQTVLEEYTPAGVARVAGRLREQTAELKKKAETKNEKATIEIVALMFQAILQEDRIPPGIRVWFARLQMPVLRVALEEPDFFGTLNHPARQLIDRMGSCVMGFDATGVQGGALEGEIKRVVQVIEQYPETGKRVYQLVYDEFQKFLARFLTEKGTTQKVVSVAQQVEQKETLTIQYTIEMRNMLKDMPVRDEIREFLFKVWAEVLAVAAVRKGPQHADTLELKKCSSELVWAASAKPNRSDRAKVIAELPKLLQRLRAGMTLLGFAPSQQDVHVKTVSDTLADAFLSKTQAIPQAQIEAMAKRLANLEDFVSEDGMGDLPLDADSIEIMLGIDASTIDVVADGGSKPTNAMLAWAQELQLGAWFTLDHNGRVTNVQFAWRSDRKHLNLFASTAGHSYLIQAGRLAAYLQAGLLLPQEEETLTVRATRDALAKLEANPERLLG